MGSFNGLTEAIKANKLTWTSNYYLAFRYYRKTEHWMSLKRINNVHEDFDFLFRDIDVNIYRH